MKKLFYLAVLSFFFFNGCIVFKSVSYEITITEDIKGSSLVTIEDLSTDAATEEDLDNDKQIIFDYAYQSNEFLNDMNNEGKKIISRNLFVQENKLNALISYEFDNITDVEQIQFDDPYYFLTLSPEDSIISTNGQIFISDEYKRIVWDKSIKTLKFKIFNEDTDKPGIKSLAPYYKK
jgi:hypothetical protein